MRIEEEIGPFDEPAFVDSPYYTDWCKLIKALHKEKGHQFDASKGHDQRCTNCGMYMTFYDEDVEWMSVKEMVATFMNCNDFLVKDIIE